MANGHIFEVLVTLGGLFLLGLLADLVGRNTFLPRVTLMMLGRWWRTWRGTTKDCLTRSRVSSGRS